MQKCQRNVHRHSQLTTTKTLSFVDQSQEAVCAAPCASDNLPSVRFV